MIGFSQISAYLRKFQTLNQSRKTLKKNFLEKTDALYKEALANKKSWADTIIMASIIEEEAATAKDRRIISGLLWKDRDGKIRSNKGISMITNLDSLPFPARDLINISDYCPSIGYYKKLPNITIVGSRGCPYKCTFCHTTNDYGNKLRMRSPKNVADEIEECVKKYGAKDVIFWDNVLTINKKFITELCHEILSRKLNITWCGATRADLVDYETLKLMKKAGCWRLLFGLESSVQKNLNILEKNTSIEKVKQGLTACDKAGIESFCTFIFGLPGETYEEAVVREIKEAANFLCKVFFFGSASRNPVI